MRTTFGHTRKTQAPPALADDNGSRESGAGVSAGVAGYAAARSDLALARESLLPIRPVGLGREYGFHPSMPEVQQLFDEERLGVIANVGTLVERVTLDELEAGAARLPLGLYSHSDQIRQWQTSLPDSRSAVGWGGRVADLLEPLEPGTLPLGISLSGANTITWLPVSIR